MSKHTDENTLRLESIHGIDFNFRIIARGWLEIEANVYDDYYFATKFSKEDMIKLAHYILEITKT